MMNGLVDLLKPGAFKDSSHNNSEWKRRISYKATLSVGEKHSLPLALGDDVTKYSYGWSKLSIVILNFFH